MADFLIQMPNFIWISDAKSGVLNELKLGSFMIRFFKRNIYFLKISNFKFRFLSYLNYYNYSEVLYVNG
jgi:hypothetical protein